MKQQAIRVKTYCMDCDEVISQGTMPIERALALADRALFDTDAICDTKEGQVFVRESLCDTCYGLLYSV